MVRGKESNFSMEKSGEHYLIQVLDINISSEVSCYDINTLDMM